MGNPQENSSIENRENLVSQPDENGFFGPYGGRFVPEPLVAPLEELTEAFLRHRDDEIFREELAREYLHYSGRPTPLYHAERLSEYLGATVLLKREDLNHLGAHKLNNCLGQALLARRMGKKKIIAETGAGQHGVATAAVAARLGLACDIYMGEEDMRRQHPNVTRIELMGARVVPATSGDKTLTAAVDEAIGAWVAEVDDAYYLLGSAVGPHPYPLMVRHFQSIIGQEARRQVQEQFGRLPDLLTACAGGGSNAIGLFHPFMADEEVKMVGVEAAGSGVTTDRHAATMTTGKPSVIHGMNTYCIEEGSVTAEGNHCIAAGLDYPGIGPEHSLLKDTGRVRYEAAGDREVIAAFENLCRFEGIIPALESSHALAYLERLKGEFPADYLIIVNLSGRGDKDMDEFITRRNEVDRNEANGGGVDEGGPRSGLFC
ncbi:MAG: tryptophan synthase subunit beta [Candidatus Krumholzibacteria bacterium]|nr:tryptophan synthase subunit beta [Candidatus Krumholzibacteria bacterium]